MESEQDLVDRLERQVPGDLYTPTPQDLAYHASHVAGVESDADRFEDCPVCFWEHGLYLDGLRESGVTNMFGAGQYLQGEFDLTADEANTVLTAWMRTYGERHPNG